MLRATNRRNGVRSQGSQRPQVRPIDRAPIDITAVDLGGDVVIVTDRDGTIIDVNEAFVRVTGFSRAEAIGASPRLLSSGLQSEDIYEDLWSTVLDGRVWTGQLVDRHRDGSLRTHRVTITPLQDADGRVAQLVAVQRDLAAQRTQPLVPNGIGEMHTDGAGRCTYADAEAARLLGTDIDDLYAVGWEQTVPEDDAAAINESVEAVMTTGRHQRLDIRTDGSRWLHLEIGSLTDPARGMIGTSWRLEDITSDMESHARLARRDAVVATLLSAITDPVAVVNADGTVLATNPAWSRLDATVHPLLACTPGDNIVDALRQADAPDNDHAAGLGALLRDHLRGLPTTASLPPELELLPLPSEHGGLLVKLTPRSRDGSSA
jgi:PAS domain S-box-containing protein